MKTILVPNSNIPPGYSIIWKLYQNKYKIYSTWDNQSFAEFNYSKYECVLKHIKQPKSDWLRGYDNIIPTNDIDSYFKSIFTLCIDNEIREILLINDLDIYLLSRYKEEFRSNNIQIFCPDFKVFINISHKFHSAEIAKRYRLDTPETFLYRQEIHDDFLRLIKDKPLIIKAEYSHSSLYVWKAYNEIEFNMIIKRLLLLERQPIIQEYIEATKHYSFHYVTDSKGKVTFGFTLEKFRHLSPSWSTSVKVINNNCFYNSAVKLIESFKQAGFWVIQGQKAANGNIYFIEINSRFGNNSRILFELFDIGLPSYVISKYNPNEVNVKEPKIRSKYGVSLVDDYLALSGLLKNERRIVNKMKIMGSFLGFYLHFPRFDIYIKRYFLDRKYCANYFINLIKTYRGDTT